jgi:hypothetical protein
MTTSSPTSVSPSRHATVSSSVSAMWPNSTRTSPSTRTSSASGSSVASHDVSLVSMSSSTVRLGHDRERVDDLVGQALVGAAQRADVVDRHGFPSSGAECC